MSLPRFYVEGSIQLGQVFRLPDSSGHHLARVLRKTTDDNIVVFNGEGGEYACTIESIRKSQVEVKPTEFNGTNRKPGLNTSLGLCILKKDSMDSVLSKITELGVSRVTPIISDRCTVAHKVIRNREAHWQQVVIAACEQCGLNVLPVLEPATNFDDWLAASEADIKLIALPGESNAVHATSDVESVAVLTGPEGGFSETEEQMAMQAGFNQVTFGERVLRAETAPVVALSVIHQVWGGFGFSGKD